MTSDLIARLEVGTVEQQRELLEEVASVLLWQPVPDNGALETIADTRIRFYRMLDAEAYLSAAMMLLPEGWTYTLRDTYAQLIHRYDPARDTDGKAATTALALAAACLRAREVG